MPPSLREVLQTLIDHGANVNATDKDCQTALVVASDKGNTDAINVLLTAGADPNIADANGNTCLHFTVHQGCNKEVVQMIIDHGAHVIIANKNGLTALMIACERGNIDVINILLEAGSDTDITDANGNTCLQCSVLQGCSIEVLQTIIDHGAQVNATNKNGQTALMMASDCGYLNGINMLLRAGADPNVINANGNTCLHFASCHGSSKEVLQTIIDHGVNVNATNKKGHTALMMASEFGHLDGIHVLLKAGAQPNITDVYGNTCLHFPVIQGRRIEVLEAIIDHGVDVNASNKKGQTALMIATEKGNIDAIKVLKSGADPNITNADGNTCLHLSILHGCSKEVVQMIIDHGAHVNATNKNGLTALMITCERGNIDVMNVLLKAGSDPAITDASGNTCLQCLVLQGCSIEVLQTIIDHGAQVNATNKNGQTALMMASDCGYLNGINMLLRAGADPNVINVNGSTCLHFASCHGSSKEVLQTIIDHGVNVNATNKKGHTALMMASEFGHLDDIHVLLKAGAQPNITDVYGNTCLHFPVIQGRHIEVLEAIIDHGVDVNASNKKGQTALMIATEKGNIDALNVLKAGADPNITNADGNTCLHLSILHGCRKEVVQMIIDHGAHVNATNKNGLTALMIASCKGNVDGVNALLKTGANHYITDADGNTCLHYSIFGKWRREVLEMIIDHGAHVNDTGENGHTALMMACERGNIDGINLLLKAGADVNISCAKGNTCLYRCMIGEYKNEVLQTMISCGAQVNTINEEGLTALMIASKRGNIDGINLLLKAGADGNISCAKGNTCLHHCMIEDCKSEVLHALSNSGAQVNAINKRGRTALMIAIEKGHIDGINVLLKAGADPNIIDVDGNTCLHCSILWDCRTEVLHTMIDNGAQVNATNKNGLTALMMASYCGYLNGINMLLRAGADPNVINANGSTCLHFASCHGSSKEVLQTIIDHGVNVNATNKKGHTALMMASEFGHLDGIHG